MPIRNSTSNKEASSHVLPAKSNHQSTHVHIGTMHQLIPLHSFHKGQKTFHYYGKQKKRWTFQGKRKRKEKDERMYRRQPHFNHLELLNKDYGELVTNTKKEREVHFIIKHLYFHQGPSYESCTTGTTNPHSYGLSPRLF